jgi:hypothetical protein
MDAILNSKNMISDIVNGISVVVDEEAVLPVDRDNDSKCTLWVKEGDVYTPDVTIQITNSLPSGI